LDVLERVTRVVAEKFAVTGPIAPSDGPAEVRGWDSLGTLHLLLAIEEEFHLVLPEDALQMVRCVGDLASVVRRRLEATRGSP
jgi:acyl carrier protein